MAKKHISTHTPLARRDSNFAPVFSAFIHFNSHASCEARQAVTNSVSSCTEFQLTRLLRGATSSSTLQISWNTSFQLTRLLRGATGVIYNYLRFCIPFQLTRLLRGATITSLIRKAGAKFQLTRLLRGATLCACYLRFQVEISTHTPLARRDVTLHKNYDYLLTISTHTPLARRDQAGTILSCYDTVISTHTPLARRDCRYFHFGNPSAIFQLTRLLRGATESYRDG